MPRKTDCRSALWLKLKPSNSLVRPSFWTLPWKRPSSSPVAGVGADVDGRRSDAGVADCSGLRAGSGVSMKQSESNWCERSNGGGASQPDPDDDLPARSTATVSSKFYKRDPFYKLPPHGPVIVM